MTSVSKQLHSKGSSQNVLKTDENELEIPKKKMYISRKRQQIIDELILA